MRARTSSSRRMVRRRTTSASRVCSRRRTPPPSSCDLPSCACYIARSARVAPEGTSQSWSLGDARVPPAVERSVRMGDGTRLSVRTWAGPADRTPLVLCDGLGCDGYVWPYLLQRFAGERPIVHAHYRGHGKSDVPDTLE